MGSDTEDDAIVQFTLAQSKLKDIESYAARGRQHRGLDDEALHASLVSIFHQWAQSVTNSQIRGRLDDVLAEYALRKSQPPFHLVRDKIDIITAEIARLARGLDEERLAEIGAEILAEYEAAQNRRN